MIVLFYMTCKGCVWDYNTGSEEKKYGVFSHYSKTQYIQDK